MASKTGVIVFVLSLVIGFYFINVTFKFVVLPKFLSDLNEYIMLVGGIVMIIGGFYSLKGGHKRQQMAPQFGGR